MAVLAAKNPSSQASLMPRMVLAGIRLSAYVKSHHTDYLKVAMRFDQFAREDRRDEEKASKFYRQLR